MGQLIAVLSGKGGTGKTTVCAGIASALAMSGESVLCIDCDVGLRNLDIALGMSDSGALSFLDVCRDGYSLDLAAKHIAFPNLSFLTAPIHCNADGIDRKAFLELLTQARKQFSYILLDAPAGLEAGFSLAARYADRILLVATADPAAVRDVARAAEVLEGMEKTDMRLILNRVHPQTVSAMGWTVDDIMDSAALPLLGLVPEDKNVVLSAAYKIPLLTYTRRGAAAACKRIAKRLQGRHLPIHVKKPFR